jgi:hypothetical protein
MKRYAPSDYMIDVDDESTHVSKSELYVAVEDLPRWIPVSERLPEHQDTVLLYVEDYGGWITLGQRSGDGWYVNEEAEGGGPKPLDRFTHWMPLPEPPTKGTYLR